jgi:hypothetical protein
MNLPMHYHNAYLYSKLMVFFDPSDQGYFEALRRDLEGVPLVDATTRIDEGRLRDARTGAPLKWKGKPQVLPLKPALGRYLSRGAFAEAVEAARRHHRFRLDG